MHDGTNYPIKADSDFYTHLPFGCLTVTPAGVIRRANLAAVRLLASDVDKLVNSSVWTCLDLNHHKKYKRIIEACSATGEVIDSHLRFVNGDGTLFWARVRCTVAVENNNRTLCHLLLDDGLEYGRIEKERELVAELMVQLNSASDLNMAISRLTRSLQHWSGCEAVGVRLRRGEDYPYLESRGFSPEFVRMENRLCLVDEKGSVVRDSSGKAMLECMCGNVLSGKVDPLKPFFTEGGSFWCNDASQLLAGMSDAGHQAGLRDGCTRGGYASVALVPLRVGDKTLGLLQFNDRRPNRFTKGHIVHYERIAEILSLALSKRQTEEDLKKSECKFRAFAAYTYAMETWRRPDNSCGYVSPSCERVTGYPAQAFLDNPNMIEEIAHPDDQAMLREHFHHVLQEQDQHNTGLEFRIVTPGGETRWLSHSCTAIYGEDGTWLGRRGSYRDITKLMLAEQGRARLERKLRQVHKQKSLERMAGAIVHHFNNKLHVVQLYLQLAMEGLPSDSPSYYNISAALGATEKASEVSRLMHTYLGHATGTRDPFDLAALCREHLDQLVTTLPQWITLKTDLPTSGPIIDTNKEEIYQILSKLVVNAREATEGKNGFIQIRIGVVAAAEIPAVHRFPGDWRPEDTSYARLEVQDNGCGLSDREMENAFDPFYSTKFTGRGLGLPVVLGLTQAHHGVVTVDSAPDGGSTFSVFFPLSVAETVQEHQAKNGLVTEGEQSAGKVLVVDDDDVVREINSTLVSMLGYEVLTAKDGQDALDIFCNNKDEIRLVLSDFAMPHINGVELFSAIRKLSPGIPVIIASGYSVDLVMGEAGAERPQYYLGKPFTIKELRKVMAMALDEESAERKKHKS